MKNTFYITLKALFVFKIFKFLYCFFGHVEKWIRNTFISKFVTSQPGKQTIAIHILPNISRREGNQTIKFGQLIEYNRNIFLEKSYTKSKLSISMDQ